MAFTCYEEHTGIDVPDNKLILALSPNPVRKGDPVILNTSVTLKDIVVFSLEGMVLKKFIPPVGDSVTIDTSDLTPGLYLITVITNDNRSITKKIIVI